MTCVVFKLKLVAFNDNKKQSKEKYKWQCFIPSQSDPHALLSALEVKCVDDLSGPNVYAASVCLCATMRHVVLGSYKMTCFFVLFSNRAKRKKHMSSRSFWPWAVAGFFFSWSQSHSKSFQKLPQTLKTYNRPQTYLERRFFHFWPLSAPAYGNWDTTACGVTLKCERAASVPNVHWNSMRQHFSDMAS